MTSSPSLDLPLPDEHRRFLERALPVLQRDARVVGLVLAGSAARAAADEHSDLDLVVAVADDVHAEVMVDPVGVVTSWTTPVAAFTGEHVGEPRLVIALVGPPLLHVDLKLVRASDVGERVDDVVVLWERGDVITRELVARPPRPVGVDLQWVEDRFWVWVHYAVAKIDRGELFEAVGFLAFLREVVLGPLVAHRQGRPAQGVRRLETLDPERATRLRATVPGLDAEEVRRSLVSAVELYRAWRDESGLPVVRREEAEALVVPLLQPGRG